MSPILVMPTMDIRNVSSRSAYNELLGNPGLAVVNGHYLSDTEFDKFLLMNFPLGQRSSSFSGL
jgi:hypothetical protein